MAARQFRPKLLVFAVLAAQVTGLLVASSVIAQGDGSSPAPTQEVPSAPVESAASTGSQSPRPSRWKSADEPAASPAQEAAPERTKEPNETRVAEPEVSASILTGDTQTLALPTGADKSGVTSQSISTPKGAGSIQGMGESFSAQLSTGVATYSVPFSLSKARGKAQPSLALSYSSGSGAGLAGIGWDVGVPFIARQTDRGTPLYRDPQTGAGWNPTQDRFVFNGGQELVPICLVGSALQCQGALPGEQMPAWGARWQYFRARVEGSFLRFFWAPDHLTWRVQDKDGGTMELGMPLDGSGDANALERNPDRASEIFRWHLSRQFDTYGGALPSGEPQPVNVVVYKYFQDLNRAYLSDIFDTPPVTGTTSLATYAHHTHLAYEKRTDPTESYRSGWRIGQELRLKRLDLTSKEFATASSAVRRAVRRYHLSYDPAYHPSLLASVQIEGRCGGGAEAQAHAESARLDVQSGQTQDLLPEVTACPRLPAMSFGYGHVQDKSTILGGFEVLDRQIQTLGSSPTNSIDEELTDLFDINADGLPDVLVTAPGLYDGKHGVYFNGLDPSGSAPNPLGLGFTADTISVDGTGDVANVDANILKLSNSNVAPLDMDADGLIDLVHMPRIKKYEVFTPKRTGGLWKWLGRAVNTASGQDPKIDFSRDASRTKVMDVNYDGLVDVVVSTGTELETFFSLGRFPAGDGQFGQAAWAGATTATLSNDPVTSCLPWSATPIQFDDADVRVADMNGDGLPDLVRLRAGDVRYWPGRGNGTWGTGLRDDCLSGNFGEERHVAMASSPNFGVARDGELLLDDVNGDGLADLVEVRFNDVDVYLNVDGQGWTPREVLTDTPTKPPSANRVRLVDINGSGTRDLLYGDGRNYRYIDLSAGKRPWLLTRVENGLGKTATLEYSTSTEEMLAAEKLGGTCPSEGPSTGTFDQRWCTKMPTVAHVVKRVTETDNLTVAGKAPGTYTTEYSYRDPIYEGRQREFRGFARARAKRLGDDNSPTDITETSFLLGECVDEDPSDGVAACDVAERWRDNPREALKGLPVSTEKLDANGAYLSTDAQTYRLRTLYTGLDGREVRHAFQIAAHQFVYDNAPFRPASAVTKTLPILELERVPGGAAVTDKTRDVPIRASIGTAELFSSSEVDVFGNQTQQVAYGCVGGDACPTADEIITQQNIPARPDGDQTGWLWRTVQSFVTGSQHPGEVREQTFVTFSPEGDPLRTEATLTGSLPLLRNRDAASDPNASAAQKTAVAPTPATASLDARIFVSGRAYDSFGNPKRELGANGRCRDVKFDDTYADFPTLETTYTGGCGNASNPNPVDVNAPGVGPLAMAAVYDRGYGALTLTVDMQMQPTRVVYDGFGRMTELTKASPTEAGSLSAVPSVKIDYFLPPDLSTQAKPAFHSIIHTQIQDAADLGQAAYQESYQYVDGFGRSIVTLGEADPSTLGRDQGAWIASDLTDYDNKAALRRKYLAFFPSALTDPIRFDFGAAPAAPFGRQRYDAFGRTVQAFDLDGTITVENRYHALSSDVFDAADRELGTHHDTPASERKDGHGRVASSTERIAVSGTIEERRVLFQYLPTGEPEVITRRRVGAGSSPDVVRWLRYDSLGRMVLNVEPNTSPDFTADFRASANGLRAWRYVYNDAGDLVGTSDARGCGTNYAYDGAGRLLTEDYSPCEAPHAVYSPANLAAKTGIEVLYQYGDRPADKPAALDAPPSYDLNSPFLRGRLAAVHDRGSSTWTTFDGRGRAIKTDVRISQPTQVDSFATRYAPRWYQQQMAFDAEDREIAATSGARVPSLLRDPTGPASFGTDNRSVVLTTYTARGAVGKVDGSYGSLVSSVQRDADGPLREIIYGDAAATTTAMNYDGRRRLRTQQTFRGPPQSWLAPPASYLPKPTPNGAPSTFQRTLQDEVFTYDVVSNPIEIRDNRNPDEWPAGAKPVTRKIDYDDLYRATHVGYEYSTDDEEWVSPFEAENSGASTDPRRAKPSPQVSFENRVKSQSFTYDWLGNTQNTRDDADGFYDRSLGTIGNGSTTKGPYQLQSASNRFTGSEASGELSTVYDEAGNVTALAVQRDGSCLPTDACTQRFEYSWDEAGRLVRARRWDTTNSGYRLASTAVPNGAPAADLEYRYDAGDQRVLKQARDAAGNTSNTVYVFDSLELRRAPWQRDATASASAGREVFDYELSQWTEVPYLFAHGVRLARVVYEKPSVPQIGGDPQHVFFELGDQLGSASVVLDKATGELVERSTYQAYGAAESSYRPDRWAGFREDYRFTGKEEDVEVGLVYFGKRFLNPLLGRWVSADPLAVHVPGKADWNLYAYVSGRVLADVDPLGLCDPSVTSCTPVQNNADGTVGYSDATRSRTPDGPSEQELADGRARASADRMAGITRSEGLERPLLDPIDFLSPGVGAVGKVGVKAIGKVIGKVVAKEATEEIATLAGKELGQAVEKQVAKGVGRATAAKRTTAIVRQADELLEQAIAHGPEVVNGFRVFGNKGLVGNVFNRNILLIEAEKKGAASLRSLLGSFEAEARSAGASRISITGHAVENPGFTPAIAQRFGYTFRQISAKTIELTKALTP